MDISTKEKEGTLSVEWLTYPIHFLKYYDIKEYMVCSVTAFHQWASYCDTHIWWEEVYPVKICITLFKVLGGNNKSRFELGSLSDGVTEDIRAAQGRSLGIGVGPDVLPLASDVTYVVHGTSIAAAKSIAQHGLNRADRVHIHFSPCNRDGVTSSAQGLRQGSQAIVIVSERAARDGGIVFYRAANDVILPDGVDGVIHPRFIRAIRLLPSYELLWANEDRRWEIPDAIENGNPFGEVDAVEDGLAGELTDVEQNSESEGLEIGVISHAASGSNYFEPSRNEDVFTRDCQSGSEGERENQKNILGFQTNSLHKLRMAAPKIIGILIFLVEKRVLLLVWKRQLRRLSLEMMHYPRMAELNVK